MADSRLLLKLIERLGGITTKKPNGNVAHVPALDPGSLKRVGQESFQPENNSVVMSDKLASGKSGLPSDLEEWILANTAGQQIEKNVGTYSELQAPPPAELRHDVPRDPVDMDAIERYDDPNARPTGISERVGSGNPLQKTAVLEADFPNDPSEKLRSVLARTTQDPARLNSGANYRQMSDTLRADNAGLPRTERYNTERDYGSFVQDKFKKTNDATRNQMQSVLQSLLRNPTVQRAKGMMTAPRDPIARNGSEIQAAKLLRALENRPELSKYVDQLNASREGLPVKRSPEYYNDQTKRNADLTERNAIEAARGGRGPDASNMNTATLREDFEKSFLWDRLPSIKQKQRAPITGFQQKDIGQNLEGYPGQKATDSMVELGNMIEELDKFGPRSPQTKALIDHLRSEYERNLSLKKDFDQTLAKDSDFPVRVRRFNNTDKPLARLRNK